MWPVGPVGAVLAKTSRSMGKGGPVSWENHLDARCIFKVVPVGSAGELRLLLAFSTEGIQVPLAKIGNTRNSNCGARENSVVSVTNFEMPSDISRDVGLLLTVIWPEF